MPEASKGPRVAVVGCGYWGKNLVRNFAELGALEALVDADQERAAELAGRHGGRPMTFAEVLAAPDIAAVVLATPGPAHFAQALDALDAGKHVYVEKPLTMSVPHAEQLVARAAERGRALMVGHILRHHAAFATLAEMVRAGAIGRPRHVLSTRWNLGKILADEDVLWSLAPHDLSMVTALLGLAPEHVTCQGDAFLRPGVADMATVRLTYAAGASAEIRLNWMAPFKEHRLIVWGETGCLIFDDTKPWEEKLVLRRMALDWADPPVTPGAGTTEPVPLPPSEPLKAECRDFLAAIAEGRPPLTDGREGLAVVALLARAERSMAAGGAAC
jgi:UDP-2-acetamido-3-amino-2,3-dideoxy-glucuronate N-acetyltransferase